MLTTLARSFGMASKLNLNVSAGRTAMAVCSLHGEP